MINSEKTKIDSEHTVVVDLIKCLQKAQEVYGSKDEYKAAIEKLEIVKSEKK